MLSIATFSIIIIVIVTVLVYAPLNDDNKNYPQHSAVSEELCDDREEPCDAREEFCDDSEEKQVCENLNNTEEEQLIK